MNLSRHNPLQLRWKRTQVSVSFVACATVLFFSPAGCKSNPTDDGTLTHNVQSSLSDDSSLNGLGIQGNVQGGVATLSGSAQNDAQRSLAARDASGVQGIREVVNNISINPVNPTPATATVVAPLPAPIPVPIENTTGQIRTQDAQRQQDIERQQQADRQRQVADRQQQAHQRQQAQQDRQQAPIERTAPSQTPANGQVSQADRPAPAPPKPVFSDVTVPAGYAIAVRVTQTIDSTDAQEGQSFSGVVANDVMADGMVAIPAGTRVSGKVDAVQEAAHFKGNSLLTVSLTSVNSRGQSLPVSSEPYTVEGKGRGKNTIEKTGGGAAVGAILGGIFGGGKGAAIGAATGGGLGAGANAITRGQQVQIPSESIVRFRLTQPISLHLRSDGQNSAPVNTDPTLQRHPQ